jgi:hypothetical protein
VKDYRSIAKGISFGSKDLIGAIDKQYTTEEHKHIYNIVGLRGPVIRSGLFLPPPPHLIGTNRIHGSVCQITDSRNVLCAHIKRTNVPPWLFGILIH